MNKSDFLTLDDVANSLKVTRQTVSKYVQNKDLNAVKIIMDEVFAYTNYVYLSRCS